jgi:CheY-like chemotaxis protein
MDDLKGQNGLDILIAEDDPAGAEALARLLEGDGHRPRVAGNGLVALAAAMVRPPDVALLDLGLPDLDGCGLARRIRKELGERPCLLIAVTGRDEPADRERSREAGIDFHLTKPLDPAALAGLLAEHALGLPPTAATQGW